MRRFLAALALPLLLALPALAQDRNAAIEGVIRSQIDAFLADDVEGAFEYASPSIRRLFGTPDNFGQMVRDGYPMVWRPEAVQFGELREVAGRLWQRVVVRDADGRFHALDYQMIETEAGWQINGVQILAAPGVAA